MGADGHIDIWSDEETRKDFPDCDRLFSYLPNHYLHSLNGKKFHHCYNGDNIDASWEYIEDWYIPNGNPPALKRVEEFIAWLREHKTSWEIWT